MLIADIMALVAPPVTDLLRRSRAATSARQPMSPTIVAVRNERVVASVTAPRIEAVASCATSLAVGLDPAALVVAAEARVDEQPALTYAVMTRDRQAKWVLQEVHESEPAQEISESEARGEATRPTVRFSIPVDGGEPTGQGAGVLRLLAEAMSQRPVDITRVARTDRSGTFGEDTFLPPEQGRVVVDASTIRPLHERVVGLGGQALYIARSPEAAELAQQAGLPRSCLLGSDRTDPS